ncbi:transmembrane channel-like protein 3 isoform X2 [Biomphalaria pfeifferi]|uniref:Transmembrane channel-like protein 3 isoform X2 n=1 Tax=Biomphalaria pfeifferi TaxID=112525 RepID=A0AAD8BZP4_BIOPF|nr:transmembrane channel-like protein 3 isoform X2 [Biomphalaria pfeifferi]
MANFEERELRGSKNYGGPRTSQHLDMLDNIPEDGLWHQPSNIEITLNGISPMSPRTQPLVYDTPVISQRRQATEEDLKWKLRYAHLYTEVKWYQEIQEVCTTTENWKPMEYVLRNLREFPMDIQTKLRLSRKLRNDIGDSPMSRSGTLKRGSVTARQLSHQLQRKTSNSLGLSRGGFSLIALWGDTIGRIAANFGSNVASYFTFLRFLVLINSLMCILMFCFVSLPQIISGDVTSDNIQSGFFGELSKTIFFYGAYSNSTIGRTEDSIGYKRPLAYLMTWSSANFLAALIIVISMYVNYKRIKGYNFGDAEPYSTQLFTSWDFSIINRKGIEKMKGFIIHYFRETKKEESFKKGLNGKQRVNLWIIRIMCNLISVGALGGSAYLIYYVANNTIKPGLDVPKVINDFFVKYQLTLIVSGLKIVVPPLLSLMLIIERYHPRTEIKINIARTAVFYVASLVVFLASVYSVSNKCMTDEHVPVNITNTYCCWENEVGEQLFQIIILDLIVCVVVGLLVTGGQALLYKAGILTRFGKPDFNVASLILDLVYGQSLVWLGLYAAPFFAMVALVKLIIIFYFNYGLARAFCEPNNVFRASRSGTFYLFILLITLFVGLFPMTYAIIRLRPSGSCGPFRLQSRVYEVLTGEIGDAPEWLQDIIHFASTPAVIIPLLIVLILLAIYYKAKSSTLHTEAKQLRHHLEFERKVEKRKIYATAKLAQGMSESSGLDVLGKTRQYASQEALNKPRQYGAFDDRITHEYEPQQDQGGEPLQDYEQLPNGDGTGHQVNRGHGQPSNEVQGRAPYNRQGGAQQDHPPYISPNDIRLHDEPFQRMSSGRSSDFLRSSANRNYPGHFPLGNQLPNEQNHPMGQGPSLPPRGGHHNPVFYDDLEDEFQLRPRGQEGNHLQQPFSRGSHNFY